MDRSMTKEKYQYKQDLLRDLEAWVEDFEKEHGREPRAIEILEVTLDLPHEKTGKKIIYKE